MKKHVIRYGFVLSVLIIIFAFSGSVNQTSATDMTNKIEKEQEPGLVVLWTSGDPEVALKMVFMYTRNAKQNEWFDDVTFIVWGPSAKLASENTEIQEGIKALAEIGITLEACLACANMYGVSEDLEKLGIDVKWMGEPLTDYIKGNDKVITF